MKLILPILIAVPIAVAGWACSQKAGNDPTTTTNPTGTDPNAPDPGATGDPNNPGGATGADLTKNPIEGIAPAVVVLDTGAYTDGPIWDAAQGVVFFTTPLGDGALYRMREDGATMKVRDGNSSLGQVPIGNTLAKDGTLVTMESLRVMKGGQSTDAGAPKVFASSYIDTGDGGTSAPHPFDTLNDGVMGPANTLYVTDPGYFGNPIANHLFRITADGKVSIVEAYEDVPRPNGIAMSPDQKLLYVGFTQPQQGEMPYISKYYVNADGTLGEHGKFADVPPVDSQPDGIEVDQGGNVYVAAKQGIVVLKADGSTIGTITVPEQPTAMAFGGKDLQTLYITTQGTKIFSVRVNVPGVVQ
jgi:gluconolactonase